MIKPSSLARKSPQLYSHDYYLRLSKAELDTLRFTHLLTAQDIAVLTDARQLMGDSVLLAGSTEWHAMHNARPVSLAWDWVQQPNDACFQVLTCVAPRTNLRGVDGQGYDMSLEESVRLIWKRIDAIPWQHYVGKSLRLEAAFRIQCRSR
jgi:hypothetical protein